MRSPPTDLTTHRIAPACVLLVVVAYMLVGLHQPLHGDHQWRQSHYVANVEQFLLRGISLAPQTYNFDQPARMYDFPLYQYVATYLCRATGVEPTVVCRAMSILLFSLTYLVLISVLRRMQLRPAHVTFTLLLFATSPVVLHFSQTPLADNLAIFLSICSLASFLQWRDNGRSRTFTAMLVTGFLSTLIKAPIHFPCFVAMAVQTWDGRTRNIARTSFVTHAGVVLLAVGVFMGVSRAVNGDAAASGIDLRWYLGALEDRLDAAVWFDLLRDMSVELLNPVLVLLAVVGAVRIVRDRQPGHRRLLGGWLLGVTVSVIVVLRLTATHNYYLLPLVFPVVILAGSGCTFAFQYLRRRFERTGRAAPILAAALVATSIIPSLVTYRRLETIAPPEYRIDTGLWLNAHTRPSDFVFYLYWKQGNHWDPQYLFNAKRLGYNLKLERLRVADLDAIADEHRNDFDRFLIFAEPHLHEQMGPRLDELPGCTLLTEGERGRIYRYAPH